MWLDKIQDEHKEWLSTRYVGQEPVIPLAGMIGEAGEAIHALLSEYKELKHGKNPRHENHEEALLDALGDCMIYFVSWCNTVGTKASSYSMETGGWPHVSDLDLGHLLVDSACTQYKMGAPQQLFIDTVNRLAKSRGRTLESVTQAAWEHVKGRIR